MSRLSTRLTVVILASAVPGRLTGQTPDPSSSVGVVPPTVAAAPLTGAIQLDGILNEKVWAAAAPITRLTQRDPDEGALPSHGEASWGSGVRGKRICRCVLLCACGAARTRVKCHVLRQT